MIKKQNKQCGHSTKGKSEWDGFQIKCMCGRFHTIAFCKLCGKKDLGKTIAVKNGNKIIDPLLDWEKKFDKKFQLIDDMNQDRDLHGEVKRFFTNYIKYI